jgi:hypothetical protein
MCWEDKASAEYVQRMMNSGLPGNSAYEMFITKIVKNAK